MKSKMLTRSFWEPITRSLFLIATGAYLLAWYLHVSHRHFAGDRSLLDGVRTVWFILWLAWAVTMPRSKQAVDDPGPAYSGTAVVLACGFGAAFFLSLGATWPNGFIIPAMIALATLVVALLVYRFASKHAQDIGEARFDTSSKPI